MNPGDYTNAIVLIKRGMCSFEAKVRNAYSAGAKGVLVYNSKYDMSDQNAYKLYMGSDDLSPSMTQIAVGAITYRDGLILKAL